NGTIDVGHDIASSQIDKEPAAPFFAAVPAGLEPLEYIMWLYHGPGTDLWMEMYEDYNLGYAGPLGINNTEDFAWTNGLIEDLDDFKGVKFRTVGYWGEILTDLGASVQNLPGGEVYGALDKGVLDAAEFANPEADLVSSLNEVSDYVYVPGMHQPTTIMEMFINEDSWEELDPELQSIVKEAAKSATLDGLSATLTKDADAMREIEDSDTEIKELSPEIKEEIRERADDLYKELGEEDPLVKEIYESQLEVREDLDYLEGYMDTRE